MLENFIYAKQKSLFEEALNNGKVLNEAIAFIEDTKEIWNHGTYFATQLSIDEIENIVSSSETVQSVMEQIVLDTLDSLPVSIVSDGDGSKFLSDDGSYKEIVIPTKVSDLEDDISVVTLNDSTPLVESLVGDELIPINQDGEKKAVRADELIKGGKEIFILTPDMFEEAATTEIVTNAIQFTEDAWSNFKSAVWDHKIIGLSMRLFDYITNAAVPLSAVSENYAFSTYVSRHSMNSYSLTFEIVNELLDIDRYEVFITNRQINSIKNIMPDGHFIIDETMFTASVADEPISSFELTDEYKQVLARAILLNKVIGISNLVLYYLVQSISTSNINTRGTLPPGFSIINLTQTYGSGFIGHVYYGTDGILLRVICNVGVITVEKETMLLGSGDGTKFLANDGEYKEVSGGSKPVIIEVSIESGFEAILTDEQVEAVKNQNIKLKYNVNNIPIIAIPYMYVTVEDVNIGIYCRLISGDGNTSDMMFNVNTATKVINVVTQS